jgi:beta-xylosidase
MQPAKSNKTVRGDDMKKSTILLILMILVVSACGTEPTAPPAPTDTPLPPTSTPVPTATLEPSPTPDPLIFRDDFEGAIDPSWQWVQENKKGWSLTNKAGWLEVMAGGGNVAGGNIKNLLLRPVPEGNYELETKLNFKPTDNFQFAGLLIYESGANFVQFGRAFCSYCPGDGFYMDMTSSGNYVEGNLATPAPATDTVYLRLRQEGNTYTGYVSEDGTTWKLIGSHDSDMKPILVGLISGQANKTVPKPARFDYFLINALP